jgi:integrase
MPEEMTGLINSARNLFHYAMLLTLYSCGLRRSELCRLKVGNIDSQRMVLRVERGKGGVDREIPLSQKLLETSRTYWRWMRPKAYLFPGQAVCTTADIRVPAASVWSAHTHCQRSGLHRIAAVMPPHRRFGKHSQNPPHRQ